MCNLRMFQFNTEAILRHSISVCFIHFVLDLGTTVDMLEDSIEVKTRYVDPSTVCVML